MHDINKQFVSAKCTDSQANFHKVQEAYSLVAKKGTNRNDQMIIHPHALPCPMEWPTIPYYKANGKHLLKPSSWRSQTDLTEEEVVPDDYDFKQVTPVKKFRPSYLK
jgi:hypothetical protein